MGIAMGTRKYRSEDRHDKRQGKALANDVADRLLPIERKAKVSLDHLSNPLEITQEAWQI